MDMKIFSPVRYVQEEMLVLDQTKLPEELEYLEMTCKEDVWEAIRKLKVRGAPAIGIAAAYGLYIAMREEEADTFSAFYKKFTEAKDYLNSSRPTAVNLQWALKRVEKMLLDNQHRNVEELKALMLEEAKAIQAEDEEACQRIGANGLTLLKPNMGILTHCNAGVLATSQYGTALAPIYIGHEQGYHFQVFADETRPLLQGARLTTWELQRAGIDVTLICDNMAATVMKRGWIQAVIVGCDRMAANGDAANKVGTSAVAILAKEYNIPFYVALPTSTIDLQTAVGDDICIEERSGDEVTELWYEKRMAPQNIRVYNPAFDVTDAKYITAVITEKGIARPPYDRSLKRLVDSK